MQSVLLQHYWDKQAAMFAATGETEASSPAAHMLQGQRVFQGLVVCSLYAEINVET